MTAHRTKRESPLGPAARAVADNREGVFVPIDLVKFTGDLLSAVFLAQLLYWFGTGKDGFCRAQVTFKGDDRLWLAKADGDWFDETGLTAAQARQVRKFFQRNGWIKTELRRFSGAPTTHITILPALLEALEEWHAIPADEKVRRGRRAMARYDAEPADPPICDVAESPISQPAKSDGLGNLPNPGLGNLPKPSCDVAKSITEDLHTPTSIPPGKAPAVASDDGQPDDEPSPDDTTDEPDAPLDEPDGTDCLGRQITPQQLLAASLAVAFDWDPKLSDPDQRKQILACVSKLAGKGVGWDQLDEIRDRAWVMRASPDEKRNPSPAQFANEWGRIRVDPVIVSRREQAVEIVQRAVAALNRELSVADRLAAEWAVAVLLGREKPVVDVKKAMQRAEGPWSINYLERALLEVEHDRSVGRRTAALVPDDLTALSDYQLVETFKRGAELDRVSTEVMRRLEPRDPETLARFKTLMAGSDGWPRGTSGALNELRFKIGDWIRANLQTTAGQPALPKGA